MRGWLKSGVEDGVLTLGACMLVGIVTLPAGVVPFLVCCAMKLSGVVCAAIALVATTTVLITASRWALRWTLGFDLGRTAFARSRHWRTDIIAGFLLGVIAVAAVWAWRAASSWPPVAADLMGRIASRESTAYIVSAFAIYALVAVCWEVAARGAVFAGLNRHWGLWPAALASSSGIWLWSLAGPAFVRGDPLLELEKNLVWTVMSITFCWLYWRSGSLWLPIGVRYAWTLGAFWWNVIHAWRIPVYDVLVDQVLAPDMGDIRNRAIFCAVVLAGAWVLLRRRTPVRLWRAPREAQQ